VEGGKPRAKGLIRPGTLASGPPTHRKEHTHALVAWHVAECKAMSHGRASQGALPLIVYRDSFKRLGFRLRALGWQFVEAAPVHDHKILLVLRDGRDCYRSQ
jgi:hypothetical protein